MSLGSLFKRVINIKIVNKKGINMGTLAPQGPSITYTREQQEAMLAQLFGAPMAVSPVPGIYATAEAELNKIATGLTSAKAMAINVWLGILAANVSILTNPQAVTGDVWAKLNAATTTLNGFGPTSNDLTNYKAALNTWNAQNSGQLSPTPLPGIPTSLTQYK
jgi:hypothetical protein